MIGIGIDTGGTYTDAVVYDLKERKVLSAGKALTTKTHLEEGIGQALDALDQELVKGAVAGPKFKELFFANCKDEAIKAYVETLL